MYETSYATEVTGVLTQDTPEAKNFERLCLHAVDVAIETCRLNRSSYHKIYDYSYRFERRRIFGLKIGTKKIVTTDKKWKFFSISVLDSHQLLQLYRTGFVVSGKQLELTRDDRVMVITAAAPWIDDAIEQHLDSLSYQRFIYVSADEGRRVQAYPDSLLYVLPAGELQYRNSIF